MELPKEFYLILVPPEHERLEQTMQRHAVVRVRQAQQTHASSPETLKERNVEDKESIEINERKIKHSEK